MKKFTIIILLLLTFWTCKKKTETTPINRDCSNNNFEATIDGSLYQTTDININTQYCGHNPPCPFTNIYAQRGTSPTDYHFFSINLVNSTPGTYYLGKIGAKRDSVNIYTGSALYDNQYSASNFVGYETDSIYNGTLTITSKDETNRVIRGTFSFTARQLMTTDTILISVASGKFERCY